MIGLALSFSLVSMEEPRPETGKPHYDQFDIETPRLETKKSRCDLEEDCARSVELKYGWDDVLVAVLIPTISIILVVSITVVPIVMGSLIVHGTFDYTIYSSCNLTQQITEVDQCTNDNCLDSDGYRIPGCNVVYYNCTHYSCVFILTYKNVNYNVSTGGYGGCPITMGCSFDRRKISKTLSVGGANGINPNHGFGIFLIVLGVGFLTIMVFVYSCVKCGRCSHREKRPR